MELLELQARARAIRSQLALEPVTKIELDSDNDSNDSSSSKIVKNSTSTATTSVKNKDQTNKAKSSSKNAVQEANGMQIIKPSIPAVKPVRLKRNFRQRQNDDYDPDEDDETKAVENCESKEDDKNSTDDKEEKAADATKSDETKRDEPERSPSPDLIPIVQEPETYCISSDSDEAGSSSVPKYITYPTVVREKLPETEDEKFLKKIKEGSGADLRDLIKSRREGKQVEGSVENSETMDTVNEATQSRAEIASRRASTSSKNTENSNEEIPASKTEQQLDKDTEPEEGELTDGDDEIEIDTNQITILSSDDENDEKSNKSKRDIVAQVEPDVGDATSSESSSSDNDSDTDSSDAPIFKEADDDDDIIDLGKDEELDFEMERSETKNKKIKKTKKKLKVADKSNEVVSEATEDVAIPEIANEGVSENIEIPESTDDKDASNETEPSTTAAEPSELATVTDPSEVMTNTLYCCVTNR